MLSFKECVKIYGALNKSSGSYLHVTQLAEQKEKLSEVEIQAKKAEAAQRRKMQVEKAAKEAEVHLFFDRVLL